MTYRNRVDTETMRRLWEDGLDDVQIAALFGVSKQYIHQRRAEIGLPAQRRRHAVERAPQSPSKILKAQPPAGRLSPEDAAALIATKGKWADLAAFAERKGWSAVKAQAEFHRVR